MDLFIIACLLFLGCLMVISFIKLSSKKFFETYLGPIFLVILILDAIFGLILIPLVIPIRTEYEEINPIVSVAKDAIIIDLSNLPKTTYHIEKFDSYNIVTNYSVDSTKFFFENKRSFYNAKAYSKLVWSNPPYKQFFDR